MKEGKELSLSCPIPKSEYPNVLMAHGGGGRLMANLVEKVFSAAFSNEMLAARHDGAVFEHGGGRIAFTTDSYVIKPLFFPGGDIGSLAVYGTVNDLSMCGASPRYLSAGFIIEEGLPMDTLWRIAVSMKKAADLAGVTIVTGDTKVVDRGKGDGVFINTAGVGVVKSGVQIGPAFVRPGDVIVLSGDVGRHGIAVMAEREGLSFETSIKSDCAPLNRVVEDMISAGIDLHCMRDLTRGGLASALVEIAEAAKVTVEISEESVPVTQDVIGACELLGFDPFYVANEGRFVAFLPSEQAGDALRVMKSNETSSGAVVIGAVKTEGRPGVVSKNKLGSARVLDLLSGEQLPRIC